MASEGREINPGRKNECAETGGKLCFGHEKIAAAGPKLSFGFGRAIVRATRSYHLGWPDDNYSEPKMGIQQGKSIHMGPRKHDNAKKSAMFPGIFRWNPPFLKLILTIEKQELS